MSGADNRLKTPLPISLNQMAGQRGADRQQAASKGIPCQITARNGQVVTVSFQMQVGGVGGPFTLVQADYPIGGSSPTDWYPYKVGTNGLLLPSDFYLGGVTGRGGGTADYSQRGNLASLAFFPIANTSMTPPGGDADKRGVTGPNGVYLGTDDGSVAVTVDEAGSVTIKVGGKTWVFNASGLTLSNSVIAETHTHEDPQGGLVGPPENP